jgi:hypothetical protein
VGASFLSASTGIFSWSKTMQIEFDKSTETLLSFETAFPELINKLDQIITLLEIQQPKQGKAKRKAERETLYTAPFERCWKVWPRSEGKLAAAKSWHRALKKIDGSDLMPAGLELAVETVLAKIITSFVAKQWPEERIKKERQFCPHLATWLNGERYRDVLDEWDGGSDAGFVSCPEW